MTTKRPQEPRNCFLELTILLKKSCFRVSVSPNLRFKNTWTFIYHSWLLLHKGETIWITCTLKSPSTALPCLILSLLRHFELNQYNNECCKIWHDWCQMLFPKGKVSISIKPIEWVHFVNQLTLVLKANIWWQWDTVFGGCPL